ncbi:GNAT family N-acetyltransferase [Kiloniella majae]|uniref:GNAT family N-acetyltransferase n=1 Tax=Kiloniella majae TaxID=1938558 RepID=UPI000A27813E|nr:GNAT family N-acetyltransferase [Kiloniella majae]
MSDIFVNCRIETERLILRPYAIGDAPALQRIASDPQVLQYLPDDPLSIEEVKNIIAWSIGCHKKNTKEKLYKLNLTMLDKKTNELIGWCGLGPADWDLEQIEIYYAVAPERWRQGLTSEATLALRDYAFDIIELKNLVGITMSDNIASNKVLQKLGMSYQGTLDRAPKDCDPYFLGQNLYVLANTGNRQDALYREENESPL